MIEKILLDHLNEKLTPPVYMERPVDPPEKFVLLERTGGSTSNHITGEGTFAIQSYAPSLYQAAELNEAVLKVVPEFPTHKEINFARVDGYYNFTDSTTKDYRYQAVVHVGYYL